MTEKERIKQLATDLALECAENNMGITEATEYFKSIYQKNISSKNSKNPKIHPKIAPKDFSAKAKKFVEYYLIKFYKNTDAETFCSISRQKICTDILCYIHETGNCYQQSVYNHLKHAMGTEIYSWEFLVRSVTALYEAYSNIQKGFENCSELDSPIPMRGHWTHLKYKISFLIHEIEIFD